MTKPAQDTGKRIESYFDEAPSFAGDICRKLRHIIFKAEPEIVEDWKWGPNYSKNGMVCGIGAFQKHVSLAFFQGAHMKDSYTNQKEYMRWIGSAKKQETRKARLVKTIEMLGRKIKHP